VLVSIGGDEKNIVVWERDDAKAATDPEAWSVKQVVKDAHPDTLNYLSTYIIGDELYFTTMCAAGVLKLWSRKASSNEFILKSELLFGRNLQETSAVFSIGEQTLLVLVGGYDSKVHVYTTIRSSDKPTELKFAFSMLGHMNSVKDLAFSAPLGPTKEINYLASCSQDHIIRIWKV